MPIADAAARIEVVDRHPPTRLGGLSGASDTERAAQREVRESRSVRSSRAPGAGSCRCRESGGRGPRKLTPPGWLRAQLRYSAPSHHRHDGGENQEDPAKAEYEMRDAAVFQREGGVRALP